MKIKADKVVFYLAAALLLIEQGKKNAALAAFNLNGGGDMWARTTDLYIISIAL